MQWQLISREHQVDLELVGWGQASLVVLVTNIRYVHKHEAWNIANVRGLLVCSPQKGSVSLVER